MSDKVYANPDLVWSADDLHDRLEDPSLCVVDTRPTHEYVAGHILGAQNLDLYGFSLNNTHEVAFNAFMWTCGYLLGSRGIGSDRRIVFYENDSGMRAARGFWICEYLGHEDVHLLDGGLEAWKGTGYPLTTECPVPERASFEARPVRERQIGAEELKDSLGKEGFVVLDTRSDDEYYGRIARAARAGAIPGAVHVEYLRNLDENGAFKPADELSQMYEDAGVVPEQEIACYCQGGYRSAHAYLALRLLGYPRARNYVGSWKEWGDRTDLPIEIPEE